MSNYISKEELLKRTVKRNSVWNSITNSEGKNLEEIIKDISIAEVREVVYGDWLGPDNCCMCSNCHAASMYKSLFCPDCGAVMDKRKMII